jgi:hypothetical protein
MRPLSFRPKRSEVEKSLTILRSKMRDVSTAVDMTKKAERRSNFLCVMWRGGKDEIAGM